MKNNLFILLIAFLVSWTNANAQIVTLKKKKLSERMTSIVAEIDNKNFENAINLFYDNDTIIAVENFKKKDIDNYYRTKEFIDLKKNELDKTDSLVSIKIVAFKSFDFNQLNDLLDLKLTNENSYKKTQKKLNQILKDLTEAKRKCNENKINILNWEQLYKDEEYEKIFNILNIRNSTTNSFFKDDFSKLKELQVKLKPLYETYNSVKEVIFSHSNEIINSLDRSTLTYDISIRNIQKLDSLLITNNLELSKIKGSNPQLTSDYSKLNNRISQEIKELRRFSELNRPLTNNEIKKTLFTNPIVSVADIVKYARLLDEKSKFIFDANVLKYFNLSEIYDTPLKKEVFTRTKEYKKYFEELDSIRNGTFYYHTTPTLLQDGRNKTIWQYDLKKKGFEILFNTNSSSGRPFKCLEISGDWGERINDLWINVKMLPTYNKQSNSIWKIKTLDEFYFIPISEEDGIELENEKDNIHIYFIVTLDNSENIKYEWVNTSKLPFEEITTNEYVINSKRLRVLLVNKYSNKIYFDKTY